MHAALIALLTSVTANRCYPERGGSELATDYISATETPEGEEHLAILHSLRLVCYIYALARSTISIG